MNPRNTIPNMLNHVAQVAEIRYQAKQAETRLVTRLAAWITRNIFRIKGKE